jgi:hypothetical protein
MREEDVAHCIDLGEQFHSSSYFAFAPYNREKAYNWAMRGLERKNKLMLVAEDQPSQEIFGYFVANVSTFYFSDAVVSEEEQMFLHPEKRGGPTAVKFMKIWEKWAIENNASMLYFTAGAMDDVGNKFDGFMKKLGYYPTGPAYRKCVGE